MTEQEHKEWHIEKHKQLDMLLGDWIEHSGKLPSTSTVMEFLEWSYQQTIKPHELMG